MCGAPRKLLCPYIAIKRWHLLHCSGDKRPFFYYLWASTCCSGLYIIADYFLLKFVDTYVMWKRSPLKSFNKTFIWSQIFHCFRLISFLWLFTFCFSCEWYRGHAFTFRRWVGGNKGEGQSMRFLILAHKSWSTGWGLLPALSHSSYVNFSKSSL